MARSIPRQTRTQADELRDLLEASYTMAVNLRGAGADQARALLHHLDRILELLSQLEARGADLRAERVRWREVQGAVRRHAGELRAELTPLGGLKALREALPSRPSPEERWWWWLDVTAQKNLRKRIIITVAVIAGILTLMLGGVWAFNKLFPVDPQISIAYEHKSNADNLVLAGKLREALTELEAAYRATPDDPDILSMMAALYDLTDQEAKALPVLRQLYDAYPRSIVDSYLAQAYNAAGAAEKALALAKQAVEEDPANPQGYLAAGMAYEARGDAKAAMDAYLKAAEAARAAGDYESEAFAKIRLATLLQKPALQTPEAATASPGG